MAKGAFLTSGKLGDQVDTDLNPVTTATTAGKLVDFTTLGITEIKMHIKTSSSEASGIANELTISAGDSIETIISNIKDLDADLTVNYDAKFDRIFVSSKKTGEEVQLAFTPPDGEDPLSANTTAVNTLISKMGFASSTSAAGENAAFTYNGTALTSETNDVTVNGLSLTIRADSGTSNIAVTTNSDAIYESVKSFVLKYNELTLDMTTKINAESARKYNVLTSEEKSAMTEDEVKLWEDKIKSSLLRRDDTMTSIVSEMRSVLTLSSGVDTTGMDYKYLSDLGLVTGGYSENGILHIEGDEDDPLYAIKDNKLKQAIEDNPEKLMEFLSKVGQSLYDKMNERMKSSTLSSSLTLFNDKYMDSQMGDYDDKISDLEDRLAAIESRYYKQFTAMEQAIQQSNSTGDWLAQQLAGL